VDCRLVHVAECGVGKVMRPLLLLHLITQPAKGLPQGWAWPFLAAGFETPP
jgi:hypothetical protein